MKPSTYRDMHLLDELAKSGRSDLIESLEQMLQEGSRLHPEVLAHIEATRRARRRGRRSLAQAFGSRPPSSDGGGEGALGEMGEVGACIGRLSHLTQRVLEVRGNPGSGQLVLRYRAPGPGVTTVGIFDAAGRRLLA